MTYRDVVLERHGAVSLLRLHRPAVLNALDAHLIAELNDAFAEADANDEVRAVVLTGGDRVFAAGADVADMAERTPVEQLASGRSRRWAGVTSFAKPIVAAVNGYALGGGCELALMCDLIVAGHTARFGQPEVNLGIIPGAGGTQRWPRTVGKQVAMEIVLLGRPIDAERACRLGLVNRVVPAETTVRVALDMARSLAEKPPIALRLAKDAVNRSLETPLGEGLVAERRNFALAFSTDDQQEGMRAFLEKRPPEFRGR